MQTKKTSTDEIWLKVTVNKIWSKFSKIQFLARLLEKAFKFNLLKTKLQNVKNNARYVGKSVLRELERKSERCHNPS